MLDNLISTVQNPIGYSFG